VIIKLLGTWQMALGFVRLSICAIVGVLGIITEPIKVTITNFMDGVTGVGHQDHVVVGTLLLKEIFVCGRINLIVEMVLELLIFAFFNGDIVRTTVVVRVNCVK
tara:strand:- start:651 stop:962 length:312 start_codon:yes stop_codon:yes gene_type:complete